MTHAGWLNAPEPAAPARRIGPALGASLFVHTLMAAAIIALLNVAPPASIVPPIGRMLDVVYLPSPAAEPSAGGGGGGNPNPAPPRPMQIVRSDAPAIPSPAPTPVDPPPSLIVQVETDAATMLSATGTTLNAPPGPGGGGQGPGLGPGRGPGAGPGNGPAIGDGFGTVGVDATEPVPMFTPQPDYTSEAMLAKVQGEVQLDVVVLANGRVGDVRVVRGPKPSFGLEDKAIATAKRWTFKPSLRKGVPVNVRVTIILTFTLR